MKKIDFSQTVAILANVGVLAGIIFLVIEIRQNTSALYAESRQAVLSASREEILLTMDDPALLIALTTSDLLTPDESIRVDGFLSIMMRAREFAWLQFRDGAIDETQWNTEFNVLSAFFDASRTRLWWDVLGRSFFSSEFVEFVDAEILSKPATNQVLPLLVIWSSESH